MSAKSCTNEYSFETPNQTLIRYETGFTKLKWTWAYE